MSKQGILISVADDQEGATPRIVTPSDPLPTYIHTIHHRPINELFHTLAGTGASSTFASGVSAGDVSFNLTSAVGFVIGDFLEISQDIVESTYPQIVDIATNTVTIDRPIEFDHPAGHLVQVVVPDMASVAGTLLAPVSYRVAPVPGQIWHIKRIIHSMTHSAASTDDAFGSIATLANGVVIRAYVDGQFGTFTNWKNNRDMRLDMYDVQYTDKSGPSLFGTHGRGSFDRIGITVRLDGDKGDFLEMLVQDDLRGLGSFFTKAQGRFGV